MAIHIQSPEQFQTQVINYEGLSLVDFWAEWCGPCRMIGPVMEELSGDYAGQNVQIVKVNVDEQPQLASAFGVSSIPVIFFIKGGKAVDMIVGANPKSIYQAKIDSLMPKVEKSI